MTKEWEKIEPLGDNAYNVTGGKLSAADELKARARQNDPCDFCGYNGDDRYYNYVIKEDKIICFECNEKKPWKKQEG